MVTWKIVGTPKVLVLYIYIDYKKKVLSLILLLLLLSLFFFGGTIIIIITIIILVLLSIFINDISPQVS